MEFKRVFKDRRVRAVFLLLMFATVCVFLYQQYKAVKDEAEDRQLHEELGIEYTEELSYAERQKEYADGYGDKISYVLEQSDKLSTISIFQNSGSSYSSENIERTKNDYSGLADVTVGYGDYQALEDVLNWNLADYLIFLWGFFMIWMFFEDEKMGLKQVFYSTDGGRRFLSINRIGVLTFGNAVFVTASYILLFALSVIINGGTGSLFNSAQSVIMLGDCILRMNIITFIVCYIVARILLAVAISLFVWMVLLVFRSRIIGVGALTLILGAEGILSGAISDLSPLVAVKYINVFRLIQPGDILYTYKNYNFLAKPFNCLNTLIVIFLITTVLSAVVCIWIMYKRKPIYSPGRVEEVIMRAVNKIRRVYHKALSVIPVFFAELYKIFIIHKGILFLLIWVYLLASQMDLTEVQYMGASAVLKETYDEYTGPDTEAIENYISVLEEKMLHASDTGVYQSVVETLNDQLEYMYNMKDERGIEVWFLNDKPYRILWSGNGLWYGQGYSDHQKRALYDVIVLVFLLASVFSYDKSCGMEKTLRSTANGRKKLFRTKIGVVFTVCALVWAVSYGMEIYETASLVGISGLAAPVQSLSFMADFPVAMPIICYMIFVLLLRLGMMFCVSLLVCVLTCRISGIKGIVCALLLTSAMEILYLLGFGWCRYLSLVQAVVYVEPVCEYGFLVGFAAMAAVCVIGVICYKFLKNYWCGGKYHAV